jgi:HEAT repeat protein
VDVSDTTIDEQVAELEQLLAAGQGGTPKEVEVLEKIVALLQQDDSAVEALGRRLDSQEGLENPELSSALIGMLGAAGTPKAQETLIGIVNTPEWPMDQRQMAIFSFAQVTEPTPEVDGWLQTLHQQQGELSNNTLLVLAAMGDRVREQHPERFNRISQYVIEAASTDGQPLNEQIVGLEAIGNLGPEEMPQVVQDALASESSLLREKALSSLQRMDGDTTSPVIRNALHNDPDDSVRAVAAGLLADVERPGGCEDLCQAALDDPSETVRAAATVSLSEWLNTDPQLERVLEQVASGDPSEVVRDVADQALHSRIGFGVVDAAATTP